MAREATASPRAVVATTAGLPNLRPVKFSVRFHPDHKQFDTTVWVTNDGEDPALGSFKIVFAYAYYDYSQDPPLWVMHERQPWATPGTTDVQPGGTNPFVFEDCSYVRKAGAVFAYYTFWASVDVDQQINESVEFDNDLEKSVMLRPPRIDGPVLDPDGVIRSP